MHGYEMDFEVLVEEYQVLNFPRKVHDRGIGSSSLSIISIFGDDPYYFLNQSTHKVL